MMRRIAGLLVLCLVAVLVLLSGAGFPPAVSQSSSLTDSKTYAPLWLVSAEFGTHLILNNSLVRPLPLQVTLFDGKGKAAARKEILLQPRANRVLSLAETFALPSGVQSGSLEISFDGNEYDVGAQVELVGRDGQATVDVECSVASDYSSSGLSGVARLGRGLEQAALVVANTTEEARSLDVTVQSGGRPRTRSESLAAHQSVSIPLRALVDASEAEHVVGIEVEWEGEAGDVVGGVFWRSSADGYGFEALADPARRMSRRLSTANLHFFGGVSESRQASEQRLPLLLYNRSRSPLAVTLQMTYAGGEDAMDAESRKIELKAGEGKGLELAELFSLPSESLPWAALDLSWEGEPDAVWASSDSTAGGQVVRNPLVDPEETGPRAFNYAWLQTEETRTRIFIRNSTDQTRRVVAHLFTEEGEEFDFGVLKIPPRAVEVIDLEKVQEEQRPDKLGRTLSPEAQRGQFLWFPWEPGSGLLGRAVLEGKQSKAAVSLSCPQCEPSADHLFSNPNSINAPAGATLQLQMFLRYRDCASAATLFDQIVTDEAHYTSSVPSVATVNSTGLVNCLAPGTCEIHASVNAFFKICDSETCSGFESMRDFFDDVWTDVRPVITEISPDRGLVGDTVAVTLTGLFGADPSISVSGSGVTASITSASATSLTANFAISSTAAAGQRTVTVSTEGGTSNPASFKVQKPAFLQVIFNETDSNFCSNLGTAPVSPNCDGAFIRRLRYKVLDQDMADIKKAGMQIAETLAETADTCTASVPSGSVWSTDSNGFMITTTPVPIEASENKDSIYNCTQKCTSIDPATSMCGECTLSWDQTFTVDGFSVSIKSMDGQTVGIKNKVVTKCSDFPSVTISN